MGSDKTVPHDGASFFRNVSCPHFPCHEGVDERMFNCLFCYCPLYALGPRCGGDFSYTDAGVKDCSGCTRLHEGADGTRLVRERFGELAELARPGRQEPEMPA
ncbi:MAG: cysteine-rich small domain-containing protein [Coriobacteriales bacterium]|nr:cysteine-rich small domain-containing protein [Coriobacteriales bacterium]